MKNFKRRFVTLCSTIFVLMLVLSTVSVSAIQGDTWTTKASMATGRELHQAAVVNGKIYIVGGSNSSGFLNSVEEYDPATNKWTTKASMATARSYHQLAVVGGKIYAIGGCNSNGILNSVEEYDPATNKWTTKASMNIARGYYQVAVVGEKIYAIGGCGSRGYINSVEEYNPTTNKWTTKASMIAARHYHQIAVMGGKIYAMGGYNSNGVLNSVEEYDPVIDKWITKESMFTAKIDFRIAVLDGKIYAIGGYNGSALNSVEEYNPITNKWTTRESMTVARYVHEAVVSGGKIYAIGGNNSSALNSVEEYDPTTNKWTTKAPMSNARAFFQAVLLNEKIYAISGSKGKYLNSLEEYTLEYPAPTNLIAKADYGKVSLSWTPSDDATSYNLKRATVAGGPYTTIATGSAITYTDTTAVNGTTYYYVVSAVNSSNVESANSNEVSVTLSNIEERLEVVSVDKAKVGDEITANIVIHNAVNICAEDIKIAFDTSKLEFISAEGADGIKIYKEDNLTDGIRRYITASLGKANAANGDKILMKLRFKAINVGEAKIDITNGRIADNATIEKDIDEENCGEKTILIEKSVYDVNRSGEFTLLDLGIAAWYFGDAVEDTDTSKYDADVVVNGIIDDDDLSEIVRQILNNSNYPVI